MAKPFTCDLYHHPRQALSGAAALTTWLRDSQVSRVCANCPLRVYSQFSACSHRCYACIEILSAAGSARLKERAVVSTFPSTTCSSRLCVATLLALCSTPHVVVFCLKKRWKPVHSSSSSAYKYGAEDPFGIGRLSPLRVQGASCVSSCLLGHVATRKTTAAAMFPALPPYHFQSIGVDVPHKIQGKRKCSACSLIYFFCASCR